MTPLNSWEPLLYQNYKSSVKNRVKLKKHTRQSKKMNHNTNKKWFCSSSNSTAASQISPQLNPRSHTSWLFFFFFLLVADHLHTTKQWADSRHSKRLTPYLQRAAHCPPSLVGSQKQRKSTAASGPTESFQQLLFVCSSKR